MKKLKTEKGITLPALAVTIVIMLILTITMTASATSTIELKKYNEIKEDIISLSENAKIYYLNNKTLPVIKKADGTYDESKTYNLDNYNIPAADRNPNDSGKYYFIDVSLLTDVRLNNGIGNIRRNYNTDDLYVINEKSLTVYYLKGAVLDGKKHYTIVDDTSGGSYANDYYSKVTLPIISSVTMKSDGKSEKLAGIGDTVTLKIISNYSFTQEPTVTINGESVTVTWSGDVGIATYTIPSTYDTSQYGTVIPFSISEYSADGRTGNTITSVTFGEGVTSYRK